MPGMLSSKNPPFGVNKHSLPRMGLNQSLE